MKRRAKEWAAANPDRVREREARYKADGRKQASNRRSYLKRKYGITEEEYQALVRAFGERCGICGRGPRPTHHSTSIMTTAPVKSAA